MKKALVFVLTLSLIVFGSSMTAFAEEVSIVADNLGRGAGNSTVVANDDGSITTATSNISFYLPEAVQADETVTVHITGSSDGDFRVWLIDEQEVTNSDIYQISQDDFTSGDFDKTFTLTATAEATEIFFKAPAWDAPLNNLTLSSVDVELADAADVEEDVEVVEEDVEEADDEVVEAPKTGVASYALVYMALMALMAVGYAVTKKNLVRE